MAAASWSIQQHGLGVSRQRDFELLGLAKSEIFGNGVLRNGKTSGSYRRFKPYEDRSNLLREITSDGEVIEELQSIIESGIPGSNDLPVAL